jgi:hypothetical protein
MLAMLLPVLPGAVAAAADDGPAIAIEYPAAGRTVYVPRSSATVRWSERDDVTDRIVTEEAGPADANGDCTDAEVEQTWDDDHRSPIDVDDLQVGWCYRYRIEAELEGGDTTVERTGWLRILTPWTGKANLYRAGIFSTQRRGWWCVGASVQMMRNIVRGESDQSFANQENYQRDARSTDRYTSGDGARGSDPQGWVGSLRVNGAGPGYHVKELRHFRGAVRSAARSVRLTGKPVGLLVGHGSHAWVMTGFVATADPAVTDDFEVTAVYVMGSLHPRKPVSGFDPAPNTRMGMDRLKRFLTRYDDRLGPSPWDRSYVIVRP